MQSNQVLYILFFSEKRNTFLKDSYKFCNAKIRYKWANFALDKDCLGRRYFRIKLRKLTNIIKRKPHVLESAII